VSDHDEPVEPVEHVPSELPSPEPVERPAQDALQAEPAAAAPVALPRPEAVERSSWEQLRVERVVERSSWEHLRVEQVVERSSWEQPPVEPVVERSPWELPWQLPRAEPVIVERSPWELPRAEPVVERSPWELLQEDPIEHRPDWELPSFEPSVPAGAGDGWPYGSEHAIPPPAHRRSRNPVDRMTEGLPHGLRVTIDWIVTIVGAVAIVLLVKAFVVNPYRIPSSSMEPTLHCKTPSAGCLSTFSSDRVLANRFLYRLRDPRRGEIIVFKTPPAAQIQCGAGGTFVKRLIGLPGETIELRLRQGNGYVYINGKPLQEPYIQQSRRSETQAFGPTRIKQGQYFMMGDNRAASCDSRRWGSVPRANLIGKVFATYWPPNRISLH
jgi:signal peptidase I